MRTVSISLSISAAALAISALSALSGCNVVTGAGDVRLVNNNDDDSTGDTTTTGGAGGSSGATGGTGGAPAAACKYPEGMFGNEIGDLVNQNIKWDGFAENSDAIGQIVPEDYLDCDGSRGVNAIMVLKSALWCGACQQEASQLNSMIASKWDAMGIKVLTLMLDDADPGVPATTDTAQKWKDQFKLESSAVGVDTNVMTFVPAGTMSIGLPYGVIIDPRTMTIKDSKDGASELFPELEALATENAK